MAKRAIPCIACNEGVQKDEAQFVDETTFSFSPNSGRRIGLGVYCASCFDIHVRPALDIYNEKLERAKNVNVFSLAQSKESRFVRRIEKPVKVENCRDRDEAVISLAFLAVEAGNNSLLDVEFSSVKVNEGGRWKSSLWSARGVPASIDEGVLKRRFLSNPN